MGLLAVALVLVMCKYCSAQVGGCTPPTGSNLIGGNGKLSNNIPQSNRGGVGREFMQSLLHVLSMYSTYSVFLFFLHVIAIFRAARSHWRQWSRLVGNVQ